MTRIEKWSTINRPVQSRERPTLRELLIANGTIKPAQRKQFGLTPRPRPFHERVVRTERVRKEST